MKWWWKSINHFFNFYPSEKRGVLILLSTLFILILFNKYALTSVLEPTEFSIGDKIELLHSSYYDTVPCVDFKDGLTKSSFKGIQLDSNLIDRIIRNSQRYGRYACLNDLRDVRGIGDAEILYLSNLCYPDFLNCSRLNINTSSAEEIAFFFRININKGKTFVKYRNSIGGFVKFEQIKQVYGFPKYKLTDRWKQRIDLGRKNIQRFNLKQATYKILLKHGFINRKSAIALNKILKKRPLTLKDIQNNVSEQNKPLVIYYFTE